MQLYLNEQDDQQLFKLFDELDDLTREPFHGRRPKWTPRWRKNCGIAVAELRPWHYHDPFFQEPPAVLGELPESVYKPLDIVGLVRDVLRRHRAADRRRDPAERLFEKPGKNPHAY